MVFYLTGPKGISGDPGPFGPDGSLGLRGRQGQQGLKGDDNNIPLLSQYNVSSKIKKCRQKNQI